MTPRSDHYDQLRLSLGVADGSRDLRVEKATLLTSGGQKERGSETENRIPCFASIRILSDASLLVPNVSGLSY
jgi:hypothetical protein